MIHLVENTNWVNEFCTPHLRCQKGSLSFLGCSLQKNIIFKDQREGERGRELTEASSSIIIGLFPSFSKNS